MFFFLYRVQFYVFVIFLSVVMNLKDKFFRMIYYLVFVKINIYRKLERKQGLLIVVWYGKKDKEKFVYFKLQKMIV